MDEILSSIRQIIADDDEAAAQKMPVAKASGLKPVPAPEPAPMPSVADIDPFDDDEDDAVKPLALSPEQIVEAPVAEPEEPEAEEVAAPSAAGFDAAAELVVPDDVAFQRDKDAAPAPQPAPEVQAEPEPQPEPKPAANFAQAAPMPDADLSSDLADELLEPATSAAVKNAFAKLGGPKAVPDMALGASGLTIEAMIREMLRPMLKEWLEENLPSMVERLIAQEIERASRG
jgi:cell pole-organizing protein PopZ